MSAFSLINANMNSMPNYKTPYLKQFESRNQKSSLAKHEDFFNNNM